MRNKGLNKLMTYVLIAGIGFWLYNKYKEADKVRKPKLNL